MGGDVCHFSGVFRPTQYLPMPSEIPAEALVNSPYTPPCPCSIFTACHPDREYSRTKPYYAIATGKSGQPSFNSDPAEAQRSVYKLMEYDANPNIFVCISHDRALMDVLPLFNDAPGNDINDWLKLGYKEKAFWGFLGYLPKDGQPVRPPLVEGVWREGRKLE